MGARLPAEPVRATGSDDAGPGPWMQSAERGNDVEKESPHRQERIHG